MNPKIYQRDNYHRYSGSKKFTAVAKLQPRSLSSHLQRRSIFSKIGKGLKKAFKAVADVGKKAVRAVGKVAKTVGKAIRVAALKIGSTIGNGKLVSLIKGFADFFSGAAKAMWKIMTDPVGALKLFLYAVKNPAQLGKAFLRSLSADCPFADKVRCAGKTAAMILTSLLTLAAAPVAGALGASSAVVAGINAVEKTVSVVSKLGTARKIAAEAQSGESDSVKQQEGGQKQQVEAQEEEEKEVQASSDQQQLDKAQKQPITHQPDKAELDSVESEPGRQNRLRDFRGDTEASRSPHASGQNHKQTNSINGKAADSNNNHPHPPSPPFSPQQSDPSAFVSHSPHPSAGGKFMPSFNMFGDSRTDFSAPRQQPSIGPFGYYDGGGDAFPGGRFGGGTIQNYGNTGPRVIEAY